MYIKHTEHVYKRLSQSEIAYMDAHFQALFDLYHALFLRSFVREQQTLDDTSGFISMIDEPDLTTPVFVKVVHQIDEPIILDDEEVELSTNSIYLIRYEAVQRYVHSGDVLLI